MRKNTYLKTIRKDIKDIQADIKLMQELMIKFAKSQNEKTEAFKSLIEIVFKAVQANKEDADRKSDILLNVLWELTEQQERQGRRTLQ